MKKFTRKRVLYILLGLALLVVAGAYGGFFYFKSQFFRDIPNTLTFAESTKSIPFLWSVEEHGEYTENHAAMLIPVTIPGLPKTLYMQFDTGSQYSFLRSEALDAFKLRGVTLDLYQEKDGYYVPEFAADIGGNQAVWKPCRVLGRAAQIDWEDLEAINIIGTLGTDFIEGKVCSIDFAGKQIRLHDERSDEMNALGAFIPFSFEGRRIVLPATIDGATTQLFYDSGCSSFGLLTSQYHFERYSNSDDLEINLSVGRHGDSVAVHHKPCDLTVMFGNSELPLERVSYVELYGFLQNTVGRLIDGGFLGNKCLLKSTLILDTQTSQFLVVPSTP